MSSEELDRWRQSGSDAQRRRAEAARVAREEAERARKLGLRALLAERLEQRADELTDRLAALALSEDDATALRGISLWLDRVHGRPTVTVEERTAADVTADELAGMSPAERLAMLRELEQGAPSVWPQEPS